MRTIPFFCSGFFLIGLATWTFAQTPEDIARHEAVMNSPMAQRVQMQVMKQTMNSIWNGNGSNLITMELIQNDAVREGVGVSREQVQRIQRTMQNVGENMPNNPAVQPIREQLERFMQETQGGPFGPNATPEIQQRFFQLQRDLEMTVHETAVGTLQNVINENLTPDQMKKVGEFKISAMSDNPMLAVSMFDALDLSNTQRQQLDGIKKELEPEFNKNIDMMAEMQWKLQARVRDEIGSKLESITNPEERKRLVEETARKMQESNPEIQKEMQNVMEAVKGTADKVKSKMSGVLTSEQKKRMTDLVENPPDFVKRMREGNGKESESPYGGWTPGPNSWKPGDPLPVEVIKEEKPKRKFPRAEIE